MSFSVSYNFFARDKFSKVAMAMKNGIDKISQAAVKANKKTRKLAATTLVMGNKMRSFGGRVTDTGKKLTRNLTLPILGLGAAFLMAAGKIEKIETSFVGMLGSVKKAKKLVKELTTFTAKTPFQLGDVAGAAKQLLAAGVQVKDIKARLQVLGDIAATANAPLKDMASIFAKIKSKGKAMTEEILQLSDRGVPVIDVLSRGLGVAKSKIFELASQGKISFEIMTKAMIQMTKKGEVANRAMILQSKTFFGLLSTLADNIILSSAAIGKVFLPTAKKVALFMIDVAEGVAKWATQNKGLVKILGVVLGVLALIGPVIIGIGTAITTTSFAFLAFGFLLKGTAASTVLITIAMKGLALVMGALALTTKVVAIAFAILTSPITLTVLAIGALIFLVLKFTGVWDKMISKITKVGPLKAAADAFISIQTSLQGLIDKVASFVGFSSDINVKARHEINSNAASPVAPAGNKSSFEGNMSIAIADKGKNVESVKFAGFGDLDLGVSGVGI